LQFLIILAKVTKGKTARLIYQTKIMNEQIQQKSWFRRNWMWLVPVGGCLTIILLFIFGIGALIFGAFGMLTNATPYEYALDQAKKNSQVIELLGTPIDTDGIMQGHISFENDEGNADFKIPIEGPNGKARIIVIAQKIYGEWMYEELYVEIKESKERINLLDKSLEGI
jgi:hypothetical protein